MLLAALVGFPLPLLPVQILWINLVTDGFPALALAVDPKAPDVMQQPPRDPRSRILDRERLVLMFVQGAGLALITVTAFAFCLYGMEQDLDRARSLTFTILVVLQLSHAFNCRSQRLSLFTLGFGTNKPLLWAVGASLSLQTLIVLVPWAHAIFKVTPFDAEHWLLALGLGVLPIVGMELLKIGLRRRPPGTGQVLQP